MSQGAAAQLRTTEGLPAFNKTSVNAVQSDFVDSESPHAMAHWQIQRTPMTRNCNHD